MNHKIAMTIITLSLGACFILTPPPASWAQGAGGGGAGPQGGGGGAVAPQGGGGGTVAPRSSGTTRAVTPRATRTVTPRATGRHPRQPHGDPEGDSDCHSAYNTNSHTAKGNIARGEATESNIAHSHAAEKHFAYRQATERHFEGCWPGWHP